MKRDEAQEWNDHLAKSTRDLESSIDRFSIFLKSPEMVAQRQAEERRREEARAAFRARPHHLTDDEAMGPHTACCTRRVAWMLSEARVYKLSEPVTFNGGETRFVVVSDRGFEAMAFTCDSRGELVPNGEHNGVSVGHDGHESALAAMGFRVVDAGDSLPLESIDRA